MQMSDSVKDVSDSVKDVKKSFYDDNEEEEKNIYTHRYDFSLLNDKDELGGLIQHKWDKYLIIKYDRKKLQSKDYSTRGLFRSVVQSNGSILAISPPKSIGFDEFTEKYPIEECRIDELVEGTMINLFYDHEIEQWEMSTKSSIGARSYFFKDYLSNDNNNNGIGIHKQNTFRSLFLDVCEEVQLHFDELPKKYCYSFVFQHPLNRIVVPFTEKKLFLISIYHVCKGNIVKCVDKDSLECFAHSSVEYPTKYYLKSYKDCLDFQKGLKDYMTVGLSIWHTKSGSRTKLRNPLYESVRKLRGNQPKPEYRFLELLREKRLNEYIYYYPEKRDEVNAYKIKLYAFTNQLYSNYISCYIKHEKKLKEFPVQFRKLMFDLHQMYKFILKPNGSVVNKKIVIEYVNNLHPSVLMYSMNLHLRILKRPSTTDISGSNL
jgi:hypothetical protein